MKRPKSTWKPLYKEGDVVKITGNSVAHEFEMGEEVTVRSVDFETGMYICHNQTDYWWVLESELELIKSN